MPVLIINGERVVFEAGKSIQVAVSENGMHPDSYLYLIAGRPVPMDEVPPEDAEVKVMRVASGG